MKRASCVLLLLWAPGSAHAERTPEGARIVVLSDAPLGDGFVEALRIQMMRRAEITRGSAVEGDTLAIKIGRATHEARAQGAVLATWFESSRDTGVAALYVVAPDRQRALVEIVPINAELEPDTERALALKVSEVFDQVQASRSTLELGESLAPSTTLAESPSYQWTFSLDAVASHAFLGVGPQFDGQVSLGIGQRAHGWWGHMYLGARMPGRVRRSTDDGNVSAHAIAVLLGLEATRLLRRWSLGVKTELSTGLLSARGETPVGNRGDATIVASGVALAATTGFWVTPHFRLHAALGAELEAPRRRLLINDTTVLDFGRVRGMAWLGMDAVFP